MPPKVPKRVLLRAYLRRYPGLLKYSDKALAEAFNTRFHPTQNSSWLWVRQARESLVAEGLVTDPSTRICRNGLTRTARREHDEEGDVRANRELEDALIKEFPDTEEDDLGLCLQNVILTEKVKQAQLRRIKQLQEQIDHETKHVRELHHRLAKLPNPHNPGSLVRCSS